MELKEASSTPRLMRTMLGIPIFSSVPCNAVSCAASLLPRRFQIAAARGSTSYLAKCMSIVVQPLPQISSTFKSGRNRATVSMVS